MTTLTLTEDPQVVRIAYQRIRSGASRDALYEAREVIRDLLPDASRGQKQSLVDTIRDLSITIRRQQDCLGRAQPAK